MKFYLGVHHPKWLASARVPLFVSRARLCERATLPRAASPWALDSGGFSELSLHGRWRTSAREYVREVRRFRDEIGRLDWAAPQDWMCEPDVLKKTGLTVAEHQRRTLRNFLALRDLAPDLPIVPVLQGWSYGDYMRHAESYFAHGVDLRAVPVVGVGTVCRRQTTSTASGVLVVLHSAGLKLHGFGFKLTGLRTSAEHLHSADSMAWSFAARRERAYPGHTHKSCANCIEWALDWRKSLVDSLSRTEGR